MLPHLWMGFKYVGSTMWAVRVHICEHQSHSHDKNLEALLVQHFIDKYHSPQDFVWTVTETITSKMFCTKDTCQSLFQKEFFWIHRLNLNGYQIHTKWIKFLFGLCLFIAGIFYYIPWERGVWERNQHSGDSSHQNYSWVVVDRMMDRSQ